MHVVMRRYRIRLGAMELAARYARETLLSRLRQVPGFVAYYLVNAGDGLVASIGLFETGDGAAAGDHVTAEWFRDDWPSFRAVAPALTSGEVLVAEQARREVAAGTPALGAPRLERRDGVERRSLNERRRGRDRRDVTAAVSKVSQGS